MANFHLRIKEQKRASSCERVCGSAVDCRMYTVYSTYTLPICTTYARLDHFKGIRPLRITAHISHCGLNVYVLCKGKITFHFVLSFLFSA